MGIRTPGKLGFLKLGLILMGKNQMDDLFSLQIGSVAINTNHDSTVSVLVSQPGGTYVQLNCYNKNSIEDISR